MEIYLFKVKDYTTILVGVYDKEKGCMYVQRGDGTKYEYTCDGELNRVVWRKLICSIPYAELIKECTLVIINKSELKINTHTNKIPLTEILMLTKLG